MRDTIGFPSATAKPKTSILDVLEQELDHEIVRINHSYRESILYLELIRRCQ